MILENKYLKKAIHKAGYVVLVKTFWKNERKSKLEYVSPNASDIGMDSELLTKGLKLSEDYIHPEDRGKVIQTVLQAINDRVTDYVHEYRMVGGDGKVYHVSNEICVTQDSVDKFTCEFYFKNIKIKEPSSHLPHIRIKSMDDNADMGKEHLAVDLGTNKRLKNMFSTFAKLSELYTVFVDTKGKIVFPPSGPSTNLGDFYDLFEKPIYKDMYKRMQQQMIENDEPAIFDREEGGVGKISPAPIRLGKEVCGYWILGSYTQEETDRLKQIYLHQWETAELMSQFIYQNEVIAAEAAKSKGAGLKLREELERQNIINSALTHTRSIITENLDETIEQTLKDVGINLDIDTAFMYMLRDSAYDENYLRVYWDVSGSEPDASITETLAGRLFAVEEHIKEDGIYLADNATITEELKLSLMRYNFKAIVGVPIYRGEDIYGILFFANRKTGRVWASDEVRFMQSISIIIQNMLEEAEGDDNVRKVNKHLIESYNNFKVGIFVRDTYSGKVLFSNTAMNKKLGFDFTGGDSRVIIKDLHDRFDNIDGMRKPFITKEKVVNWRSYIQPLDGIMDITEIQIEWLGGEPASLVILRDAKDF